MLVRARCWCLLTAALLRAALPHRPLSRTCSGPAGRDGLAKRPANFYRAKKYREARQGNRRGPANPRAASGRRIAGSHGPDRSARSSNWTRARELLEHGQGVPQGARLGGSSQEAKAASRTDARASASPAGGPAAGRQVRRLPRPTRPRRVQHGQLCRAVQRLAGRLVFMAGDARAAG